LPGLNPLPLSISRGKNLFRGWVMRIILNGFEEELPENSTVSSVISSNQEFEVHMIVELNHRFIHQKDYEATLLKERDVLELIHPAFGG
jgi:thiamine biosynthesis protein ThiS